jgi:hypothetical protein
MNGNLLPYEQLLQLLGWTSEEMAYMLEDDFFFHKLGLLKPKVDRLQWSEPTPEQRRREKEISKLIHEKFPAGLGTRANRWFRSWGSPILARCGATGQIDSAERRSIAANGVLPFRV